MRFKWVAGLLALVLTACSDDGSRWANHPPANPAPSTGLAVPIHEQDLAVLEVALRDFVQNRDAWTVPISGGSRIVLHRTTLGKSGFLSNEQLAGEFAAGQLPAAAVADLQVRNTGEATIPAAAFSQQRVIILGDLSELPKDRTAWREAFKNAYPGAAGYARAWLPGYTTNGKQAILRFSFGPTPHGATATYTLSKDDSGRWHVVSCKLSYYA
jgi:hypothetical protein